MPLKVLVVEDEAAIQELIAVNLESAGHHVLRSSDAQQALTIIHQTLPDLVLLDWMLPGQSGLAIARQLRGSERTRAIPIIMLTAKSAEEDKVIGLEAGADDYVTKPFSPRELLARIKAVMRRRAPQMTDDVIEVQGLRLDPAAHKVSGNGLALALGPTEFRLLHFFMTHAERVHTRAQLLDRVWGDHVFVEERTVDVHIRRLRKALEASGHDARIETVRGTGYRFTAAA
jgi:two-component system, OmpR family, phosphate regulon response regulator PhoB